jgi:hypothetical protein
MTRKNKQNYILLLFNKSFQAPGIRCFFYALKAGDPMAKKQTTELKKSQANPKTPSAQEVEIEIAENILLPVNPLLQSPIITVDEENDQKTVIISEIESLAEINKQQLAVRRQRVELEVENKKLDTAKKTIDNIEKIIDAVSSADVLKRVTNSINTPLDMKLMAEAAERLTNTLKGLMNSSVIDEMGNRKRTKIMAQFQTPSGEKATMAVEVNNGD